MVTLKTKHRILETVIGVWGSQDGWVEGSRMKALPPVAAALWPETKHLTSKGSCVKGQRSTYLNTWSRGVLKIMRVPNLTHHWTLPAAGTLPQGNSFWRSAFGMRASWGCTGTVSTALKNLWPFLSVLPFIPEQWLKKKKCPSFSARILKAVLIS